MKIAFILLLFFINVLISCSSQRLPESQFAWPVSPAKQDGDSGHNFFPFAINAIVPPDNFFRRGQYLFEKWVKGSVVSANNELINNRNYFFNFNKVSQNLFLTTDFKHIIEIDSREFKSFTLFDRADRYRFEHQFLIDNHRFFQALIKSSKYSLYKSINAKFRKNGSDNYQSSGDFVDSYRYYVVFPGGNMYKEILLKKKSIIRNIMLEPEKVDGFFSLHYHDLIDEELLINLINFLNK